MPLEEATEDIRIKYDRRYCDISRKEVGPGHNKALARNEKWFITELPNKWKIDYERRKDHCNAGYFAPNNIPYKAFANFKSPIVYDWLKEAGLPFIVTVVKRHVGQLPPSQKKDSRINKHPAYLALDEPDLSNTIIVCDVTKRQKNLPRAPTAGLNLLSRELGSQKRELTDIKAGNSLNDTLQTETHRQDVLQVLKAPKVIFQKGQLVPINKPCVYLPPMLPTASSKICLLNTPPKSMLNPGGDGEEEVSNRMKKMSRPLDGKDEEENNTKALLRKNFFAKVKSIYAILCCLHNIKTRDLRRYVPFNFKTIKALAKQPLHLATKDQHYKGSITTHHYHSHLQENYYANIAADNKIPRGSLTQWEDIVLLHEQNIWMTAHADPQSTPKKQHRTLPAWKRKVKLVENRERVLKPNPVEKLIKCMNHIDRFKSEMAHKMSASLQDRENVRERTLALHMEHFVCGAVKDKSLQEMRAKTYQVRWAERKKDLEKPEWFVLLEEEVNKVFEEDGLSWQGFSALQGLKQFMYSGTDGIPLAIEKMCLLAMSLPAHYLCIEQIIHAFQFVLEFFLKTSPKLIDQLREIRHLPPVLELHPPDFLFGMHI